MLATSPRKRGEVKDDYNRIRGHPLARGDATRGCL